MSQRPPLLVVAACIEHKGQYLAAQRPEGKHLGLKWEFPGGKVEPGEACEAALIREIREELGCTIENLKELPFFVHHYDKVSIEMHPYLAKLAPDGGSPHPHEHKAIRWLTPKEFGELDWAEADLPILEQLRKA